MHYVCSRKENVAVQSEDAAAWYLWNFGVKYSGATQYLRRYAVVT